MAVAALCPRFDADGAVAEAHPILRDTTLNRAGGATPWNTWLSCEEFPSAPECDPSAAFAGRRPALACSHEAAAVDPVGQRVYHRGRPNGRFYRLTPKAVPCPVYDSSEGVLEVAQVAGSGGDNSGRAPGDLASRSDPERRGDADLAAGGGKHRLPA